MQYLRGVVIGLAIVIAIGLTAGSQEAGSTLAITSSAFAQAENGTVTSRVKRWTRARLEAAKRHWAEDQQRFSECTRELDDRKRTSGRRMSYHRQGHFLEQCMRAKH